MLDYFQKENKACNQKIVEDLKEILSLLTSPANGFYITKFLANDNMKLLYHPDPRKAVARLRINSAILSFKIYGDKELIIEKQIIQN